MLVYQPAYEGFKALKLVSAAGGEVRQLLRKPRYSGNEQRWSPDSKYVVTRNWSGYWIVPVSGAKPYPIKLDPSFSRWPTFFSPDNRRLALSNLKGDGLYTAPMSLELGRMTGVPVKVFDGRIELGGMFKPVIAIKWSPDGSRLAMLHDHNLWIANSDGSASRQLTDNSDRKSSLAWSADSREIQWTSYSSTTRRATRYACELPDGELRELSALPAGAFHYQWSKDGRTVVYAIRDGERIGVWGMAVPAGEPKELIELEEERMQGWERALSPDGKMLAVVLGNEVSVISLPNAQQRKIPDFPDLSWGLHPRIHWSPDSQALALQIMSKTHTRDRVFTVSVRQGNWVELNPNESGSISFVDWSPDGEWISYQLEVIKRPKSEGTIWSVDISSFLEDAAKNATADSAPPN